MNVVLVDNLLIEQNGSRIEAVLQPHLGLISPAAVLRAAGHRTRLYDPKVQLASGSLKLDGRLYKQMARAILRCDPDVIGMTSLGCNFICTLKVAQHVRSLAPHIPIVLGGPHATILHRQILERYRAFDVGCLRCGWNSTDSLLHYRISAGARCRSSSYVGYGGILLLSFASSQQHSAAPDDSGAGDAVAR